ncbi:hypothetical protein [Geofilum rubicundum]|uniref:hypothetical protein n=1 Tax=Geofilum rubicundum TaxID=472113 RepID=UPI001D0E896D|nr:hypothetical protein [Geofilum rubicundum]
MKLFLKQFSAIMILFLTFSTGSFGQVDYSELSGQVNIINTAVPFIGITPDSRRVPWVMPVWLLLPT